MLAKAQPEPRNVREPHSQYVGGHNACVSFPVLAITRCKSEVKKKKTVEELSQNSSPTPARHGGCSEVECERTLCTFHSSRKRLPHEVPHTTHDVPICFPPCTGRKSRSSFTTQAFPRYLVCNITTSFTRATCPCCACFEIFENIDLFGMSMAVSMLAMKAVWYLEVLEMLPTSLFGPPRVISSTPADPLPQAALGSRQSTTIWPRSTSRRWLGMLESHFLLSCQVLSGRRGESCVEKSSSTDSVPRWSVGRSCSNSDTAPPQQRAHLATFGAGQYGSLVVAGRGGEVLALRLASASVVCPSRNVGQVGQLVGVPAWGRPSSGGCQVSHVVGSSVHQSVLAFSLANLGQTSWGLGGSRTRTQSQATPSPRFF